MNKYLIINADDYGYNMQQNAAIEQLYKSGLITSTSLLSVAPMAKAAAASAQKAGITVGVHLALNRDGIDCDWHSLSGKKSLCTDGGLLHTDQLKLALSAKRRDVREELEAQYRLIADSGCTVDHADNHSGTLYGINGRRFYIEAYDFCAQHNLPYRFAKNAEFISELLGREVPSIIRAMHRHIVNEGIKRNVKMLDNLISNPWPIERIADYDALRKYYFDAVDRIGEGVTEIFLHPAYPISDDRTAWTKRVYELELLKSGDLLERAQKNGIQIVSWSIFKHL